MAQVNVYVPDELKARLKDADLNLSEIAQAAWLVALRREAEKSDRDRARRMAFHMA